MEIKEHYEEFLRIRERYGLDTEEKAEEIAHFVTTQKDGKVSIKEFSKQFSIPENEAKLFLAFIERGVRFKEEHIDPHNG